MRSRYGSTLASARPRSTSVIVSCSPVWLVLRGGAHKPAPATPTTIASVATCS